MIIRLKWNIMWRNYNILVHGGVMSSKNIADNLDVSNLSLKHGKLKSHSNQNWFLVLLYLLLTTGLTNAIRIVCYSHNFVCNHLWCYQLVFVAISIKKNDTKYTKLHNIDHNRPNESETKSNKHKRRINRFNFPKLGRKCMYYSHICMNNCTVYLFMFRY